MASLFVDTSDRVARLKLETDSGLIKELSWESHRLLTRELNAQVDALLAKAGAPQIRNVIYMADQGLLRGFELAHPFVMSWQQHSGLVSMKSVQKISINLA